MYYFRTTPKCAFRQCSVQTRWESLPTCSTNLLAGFMEWKREGGEGTEGKEGHLSVSPQILEILATPEFYIIVNKMHYLKFDTKN